jgi:phosphoadenosine phosphosulfate reductase
MNEDLRKKVDRAVKLIQSAGADGSVVEVAYSGGKDSDVILELARMSGIKYRAIYKNTTIDPPFTIKHVRENGVEVLQPKRTFLQIIEKHGFPNRLHRFCCAYLKEYKVLDKCVMGVQKAESTKRAARYNEPTECRFYGSKKEHVEAFYPILDWNDQDVVEFVTERGMRLHPIYYREDGTIDPSRRLGCMCCPLASKKKRIEEFKKYPNMVKYYLRGGRKFMDAHQHLNLNPNEYSYFVRDVFYCDNRKGWDEMNNGFFDAPDYKKFLEDYFNITL